MSSRSTHRPMGPLEEGDQRLITATSALASGEFRSDHKGIHKPYSVLLNIFDGTEERTVESTHFRKREFIRRKRVYEGATVKISEAGIGVELRYAPDDSADAVGKEMQTVTADGRNVVRCGDTHTWNHELAQAMKMEAARRIWTVRQHIGATGVRATS